MDNESGSSSERIVEPELEPDYGGINSDPDSDELTINEEMLVPIVEIKEDLETNWKLKKRRNRVKARNLHRFVQWESENGLENTAGSEYRTSLVFKWFKVVQSPNGPVFKFPTKFSQKELGLQMVQILNGI